MESIIGKKYIPNDNSYAINLTSCSDYPYKNENLLLAGTHIGDEPKECTILTEPFEAYRLSFPRRRGVEKNLFIIVGYENTTHMILFYEEGIQK